MSCNILLFGTSGYWHWNRRVYIWKRQRPNVEQLQTLPLMTHNSQNRTPLVRSLKLSVYEQRENPAFPPSAVTVCPWSPCPCVRETQLSAKARHPTGSQTPHFLTHFPNTSAARLHGAFLKQWLIKCKNGISVQRSIPCFCLVLTSDMGLAKAGDKAQLCSTAAELCIKLEHTQTLLCK